MKVAALILGLAASTPIASDQRLAFVQDFISMLSNGEELREQSIAGLNDKDNVFPNCIRDSTRLKLEMAGDAADLTSIKLEGADISDIPKIEARIFDNKADQYEKMSDICAKMIGGPQPNVNYSEVSAEMPKIGANLDYLDNAIFKSSPLIFAVLIDPQPDAQGHASKLVLTCKERDELVRTLNRDFKHIGATNVNYIQSTAAVLKAYLTKKGYSCRA
jgi:hypothetical protein